MRAFRIHRKVLVRAQADLDIARHFAADSQGLSRATIEALAIEGVRSGKLSSGQARRLLGFNTRMEVDGFLKEHGAYLPLTVEDVEHDAKLSRDFREQRLSSRILLR